MDQAVSQTLLARPSTRKVNDKVQIVVVDVWVEAESTRAFEEATKVNAAASRLEPGIARFDVIVDASDPTHYQLIEVYRSPDAPAAHKQTAHYETWRAAVEPMMARPRSSTKFQGVSPTSDAW